MPNVMIKMMVTIVLVSTHGHGVRPSLSQTGVLTPHGNRDCISPVLYDDIERSAFSG